MTMRAVHAGAGYMYLLRSVATNDADLGEVPKLASYYQAKGTPPGKWIGSGLEGLVSERCAEGVEISEVQMAALYGEGLHPDADDRIRSGAKIKDVQIGRAFSLYSDNSSMLAAIGRAERQFRIDNERLPTDEERSEFALAIGCSYFTSAHGRPADNGQEVIDWVNAERDKVKQAVSGFDLTFSPTKSVSVLWALADEKTASHIAALHHEAVAEALRWTEGNALFTRRGVNGIEQIKTRGMIASEFTHFDTRGGDPDLHSHVLVANRVQGTDGKWRTLDSRALFHMNQAISARYDVVLQDLLNRRMGIEFQPRYISADKEPVWEIDGVDDRLIERFSSRRANARPVYEQMVSRYWKEHGKGPSRRASYALWQAAILATRDAKRSAESLATLRAQWRSQAAGPMGERGVDEMVSATLGRGEDAAQRPAFDAAEHAEQVAAQALEAVVSRRAQFRRSHLDTAVSAKLKGFRFASDDDRAAAHEATMGAMESVGVVQLTPSEMLSVPERLRTETGEAIDRRANALKFTTRAVLDAEAELIDSARVTVPVFAARSTVDAELEAFADRQGFALNPGQRALAEHFLCSGAFMAAGVGPAGTGKTASMRVVADAWRAEGRAVVPLSTSAAAAENLGQEIGLTGHTIDSLTHTWRGKNPNKPGGDLAALPVSIAPGDMLLVDEAGMVTTENLLALRDIAQASGAVLRLVGDPLQLDAVETGGLFRDLVVEGDAPALTEVVRMGTDTAQGTATLALRDGDGAGLDLHASRGWLHAGARLDVLSQAADAYIADTADGKTSLLLAATNSDVDELNAIVRAHRIDTAVVDTSVQVTLGRGGQVGVGDTVLARTNATFDDRDPDATPGRIKNGDLFTVAGIGEHGQLHVVDQATGRARTLPARYVAQSLQLGYATTVHRAQGATVDTCHTIVDGAMNRAGFYVAMTRGKTENHAWAVTDFQFTPGDEDAHMHSAGDVWPDDARAICERVLANDASQRSATTTLREEMAEATSTARVAALHAHGQDIAADEFCDAHLPALIDALPTDVATTLAAEEAAGTVRRAWKDALRAGVNPLDTWDADTAGLGQANNAATLLAWRLRQHIDPDTDTCVPATPPMWAGADVELHVWLDQIGDRLADANAPLADVLADYQRDWSAVVDQLAAHWLDPIAAQVGLDDPDLYAQARSLLSTIAADGGEPERSIPAAAAEATGSGAQFISRMVSHAKQTAVRPEHTTWGEHLGARRLPACGEGIDADLHERAAARLDRLNTTCRNVLDTADRSAWEPNLPAGTTPELADRITLWRTAADIDPANTEPLPETRVLSEVREHIAADIQPPTRRGPHADLSDAQLADKITHIRTMLGQLRADMGMAQRALAEAEDRPAETAQRRADTRLVEDAQNILATLNARRSGTPAPRPSRVLPPEYQWQDILGRARDTDTRRAALQDAQNRDASAMRAAREQHDAFCSERDRLTHRLDTLTEEIKLRGSSESSAHGAGDSPDLSVGQDAQPALEPESAEPEL